MDTIELGCNFGLWVILARILNQPQAWVRGLWAHERGPALVTH